MSHSVTDYLWQQIVQHVSLFFPARAKDLLLNTKVRFLPLSDAVHLRGSVIAIPTDVPGAAFPESPNRVEFNGTYLRLWNRLPRPQGDGWSCLPDSNAPLWFQHRSGTLLPAYNIFANMVDLLTLREERETSRRDHHGRFSAAESPRLAAGLLRVPVFNDSVAALVAACAGMADGGRPRFDLRDVPPTLAVVLSHDCDVLFGSDPITQSIRLLRVLLPMLRGRPPRVENIWWALRNAVRPKDFYFDNITGMIDVERMMGFTSTFYMLNGTGGRFGARSRSAAVAQVTEEIDDGWQVEMHYNYDTFLNPEKFKNQKRELEAILGRKVTGGRGHYLRFDPHKSWDFLAERGIERDETLGYPDEVGYRCGIGGVFQPLAADGRRTLDIWEVPLVVMDSVLLQQFPRDPVAGFRELLSHLSCVGGAMSVVFHPGVFFNPEFPRYVGVYRRMLAACKEHGARSESTASLSAKLEALRASAGPFLRKSA